MTKVMIESFGWLYLVIVLDWYTKKIVGHSISIRSMTGDWLEAINMACNNQFPNSILCKNVSIKTIKYDFIWVCEFRSIAELTEQFWLWLERHNTDRSHSTIDYPTPCDFEKEQLVLMTKKSIA